MLHGQIDSTSAIQTFARDLALFSGTLAGSDADLRKVIDNGSATATQLRTFIEDNRVDLGELINNLVTTGDVVVKHLDGVEQILVIYPYVVEGGFTVVAKSPDTGLYDAHFGMILHASSRRSAPRLRRHRHARPAGPRRPADGHGRPLRRAGLAEQRPRRPERSRGPVRRTAPRWSRPTTRRHGS